MFKNKSILITGGTGSFGNSFVDYFLKNKIRFKKIIIFSRDEFKQFEMRKKYSKNDLKKLRFFLGDIRDKSRLKLAFNDVDIVIHAAALKHVPVAEYNPIEFIKTNIIGSQNITEVALETNVKKVVSLSTDKACSPTNVYGMSKALAERLITSSSNENKNTKYIAVRYGNVLESRGSILPLFRFQGEFKSHLTVTHTDMTRFIMTLEESVDLIVSALLGAKSGELWLPELKSMKIIDLAEIFSEQYSKPIKIVGIRPGEKLHEDLISYSESMRVRVKNSIYIMQSSLKNINLNKKMFNYSSNQDLVSKKELKNYLKYIKVFDKPLDQFIGKKIDDLGI